VLIIGGKLKLLRKARSLGLDITYFQLKDQFGPEHNSLADNVVLLDYMDWAQLGPMAEAASKAWGFSAVVSLTEPGLVPAARVTDLLGLTGTSEEVCRRFMDKWVMRRRLAAVGIRDVPAALLTGPDSLADFGRSNGFPFIVKPTMATSSLGVFRVDGPADVEPTWQRIQQLRATTGRAWTRYFSVDEFVMEAYVPGPEYSVEAFSFDGRHVVVAVTEKAVHEGTFVEVGHALPARLAPGVEESVVETVTAFLDALELRDGPSHTEVKLGPDGPVVIESHNRIGGDRINELVEAAYGIDLDTYAIGWPFRLVPELTGRPVPAKAAATRFLLGEPGRVTGVEGAAEVRAHPAVVALDVNVSEGDTIEPLADNWARIGQVVATGPDVTTAVATCEQLVNKITVSSEPESR
jgi:biotin carboxylase